MSVRLSSCSCLSLRCSLLESKIPLMYVAPSAAASVATAVTRLVHGNAMMSSSRIYWPDVGKACDRGSGGVTDPWKHARLTDRSGGLSCEPGSDGRMRAAANGDYSIGATRLRAHTTQQVPATRNASAANCSPDAIWRHDLPRGTWHVRMASGGDGQEPGFYSASLSDLAADRRLLGKEL